MSDFDRVITLGFTAERFPAGTHMCYLYKDDMERRDVVSKYVESGLVGREKVGYFVDLVAPADVPADPSALGIDLPPGIDRRGLSVARAMDTHCPDGTFVPERMLQNLRSMCLRQLAVRHARSASGSQTDARLNNRELWVRCRHVPRRAVLS